MTISSPNIRWGLLCTANINRRVIPAIRELKRGELVAVASRSKEMGQSLCQEMGNPQDLRILSGVARFRGCGCGLY